MVNPIIVTVVTGAVGTAVGNYFQNKTYDHNQRMALREAELQTANKLFSDLCTATDARLYSMRRVHSSLKKTSWFNDEERAKRWTTYETALVDWNKTLNLNMALCERYFGKGNRKIFAEKIQSGFIKLHHRLVDLHFDENARTEENFAEWSKIADELNTHILDFNVKLISDIQKQTVGVFNPGVD